jgi:hypothetical protein
MFKGIPLRNLKHFIYSFDFLKMRPDTSLVMSGIPRRTYCRDISQPGEQYALYHHHSVIAESREYYVATPGSYAETVVLDLPGGSTRPTGSIPRRARRPAP